VTYTLELLNQGNVALRGLTLGGINLSGVSCSLGNPAHLPVASSINCSAVFTFDQPNIEKGDALHATRVSALNLVPGTGGAAFVRNISMAPVLVSGDGWGW
jgi:hypothetical protein